ncbi:MAG TPA: cytochrome c oxidase subunit 3, partial [Candidatus Binatus sp.]|nr:cytochrome c oxidase subunit 3 [Candidatus Binatus sp.]
FNTILLLTSSLSAVLALTFARAGNRNGLLGSIVLTFGLGVAFLINKGIEWSELFSSGFTFSPNPANFGPTAQVQASTYFITTGAHGIHVVAGLAMMTYLLIGTLKGRFLKEDSSSVEFFGLYWHFVDIVWIFLFPLFYLL